MRVLAITNLFPNAQEPFAAQFNRQQFGALGKICQLEVLACIPWFPGARFFGRWSNAGRLTGVPVHETIEGLSVRHPRYLYFPRIGYFLKGPLYAASLFPVVQRYRGKIDAVLGAWAYPDGYAAIVLARLLNVPVVVKVHGTDINYVSYLAGPRFNLRWAVPKATRMVAVSRPLAARLVELGAKPERVELVFNGVDQTVFHLRDRDEARQQVGRSLGERLIVLVAKLEREKGVFDLFQAFEQIAPQDDRLRLVLVGQGVAYAECCERAQASKGRIAVIGSRPLHEIALWMAAADVVALPSWNEGTPNVILEAMASGRRVVATNVGGIPDLVDNPLLGELVAPKEPDKLAEALLRAIRTDYDPEQVARIGTRGSWDTSARALHEVIRRAQADHASGG
jgi:glycosyltransferase involved in cell wall biosynthesis